MTDPSVDNLLMLYSINIRIIIIDIIPQYRDRIAGLRFIYAGFGVAPRSINVITYFIGGISYQVLYFINTYYNFKSILTLSLFIKYNRILFSSFNFAQASG